MDEKVKKAIEQFFSKYPLKRFKKGQILIYGGDEPTAVFHLLSGKVRQYDINYRGDEIVVNVFKPPAFFPMSWAINKSHNQYFFETVTEVELRQAPADDVVSFLKTNPDVMYNLLSRLYSGTDGLQRRMAHLMGGSAQSRILFELIVECARFGDLQKDGSYVLSIKENELAQRAGLSRETANREVSKLKEKSLVTHKGQILSVTSLQKIQEELGDDL